MVQVFCYLRALCLPAVIVVLTLFWSLFLFVGLLFGGGYDYADIIVRKIWSRWILWCCGVTVVVQGEEHLPKRGGFLYLFTHSSLFDIPVIYGRAPKPFRFGAKIELFSIPIFGACMSAVGTLKIARDNRAEVFEVYKQAEKRVAAGEAFALAPEGGRRMGSEIAPFKSGPFIFAVNAKMPVVPSLIYGADDILANGSLWINVKRWRTKVYLRFLPMASVEGYSTETAKNLREKVREHMVSEYEDLRKSPLNF